MDDISPFSLNVKGVEDLIENKTNKIEGGSPSSLEGPKSEKYDSLAVGKSDDELLKLRDDYEKKYAPYEGTLKPRVERIRNSYLGKRAMGQYLVDTELPIAGNLQFEAEETFLAAALAKNPEPVVFCDNTEEGNAISSSIKTMLQYHSDQLVIRRKLTLMARQWSMDLLGVLKPAWDSRINDVAIDNRKIRDYLFDPDGYVDAYGDFSSWYGERIKVTAEKLCELFPDAKTYITLTVDGKMGTEVTYTEWWPNDDYCFYTYKLKVLDKHKNQYFNYPEVATDPLGNELMDPEGKPQMTTPRNHFAYPKKPAIFLSVFSLQEQPHDITSLIEQNIPNQNLISKRTEQIDMNVSTSNNGYAFSEDNFTQETGKQAANARKVGNPILIPSGGPIGNSILPLPAQALPASVFQDLENNKDTLRSSWGVQGIASQKPDEDQTARGMILNQSHDTTRIGGGIGDAIEQVADNTFNWLVQLYYVFYDDKHFAAIMGNAKAVEYVTLSKADMGRQVIVSVAPDSMKPKDEVTNINMAQALFDKGAIGPKTLLKMVDFPDAEESAADGVLYRLDPMAYFQLNFPEYAAKLQALQQQNAMTQMQNQATNTAMQAGAEGPSPESETEPKQSLSTEPASADLNNVPLPQI